MKSGTTLCVPFQFKQGSVLVASDEQGYIMGVTRPLNGTVTLAF